VLSKTGGCDAEQWAAEPFSTAQKALWRWVRELTACATLHVESGMEFGAEHAWWGQCKARPCPHEGCDVIFSSAALMERFLFSVVEAGIVVAIFDDFLGQTAIVSRTASQTQHWVYSHLDLEADILVGAWLSPKQRIGRARPSERPCPAHLHISLIETSTDHGPIPWSELSWRTIHSEVHFVPISIEDPLAMPVSHCHARRDSGHPKVGWVHAGLVVLLSSAAAIAAAAVSQPLNMARDVHFIDIPLHETPTLPPLPSGRALIFADPAETTACGAEIWPAAAALCRWLDTAQPMLAGASILELGSGTGACGLYAAGLGARHVVLSDRPELEKLLRRNAACNRPVLPNGSVVDVASFVWGGRDRSEIAGGSLASVDVVLGSDLTYAHESHHALALTLATLLSRPGPPPRVILAHEHRSARRSFARALRQWDAADDALAHFKAAATQRGLKLVLLSAERPVSEVKGHFRRWTADLSIIEVSRGAILQSDADEPTALVTSQPLGMDITMRAGVGIFAY